MLSTFSIAAVDPQAGVVAAAVASNFLAVGALVPHLQADVGVVLTQAVGAPRSAQRALAAMADGAGPERAVELFLDDAGLRRQRQVAALSARGRASVHSGEDCLPQVESRIDNHCVIIANSVAEGTAQAMLDGFRAAEARGCWLGDACLQALLHGERFGDVRGRFAASLQVRQRNAGYRGSNDSLIDLRVDGDADPIRQLRRLLDTAQLYDARFSTGQWLEPTRLSSDQRALLDAFLALDDVVTADIGDRKLLAAAFERHNLAHLFDTGTGRIDSLLLTRLQSLLELRSRSSSR